MGRQSSGSRKVVIHLEHSPQRVIPVPARFVNFFALIVHFKVRTGPQKGSSGEENTQSTLHMAIGPYRILYVLPALLGVCVV